MICARGVMAASHAKSLLLISFCFLALKCALEPNKHTSLNGIPSRWNLARQITQLGISGSDWNRKCFAARTRAGYAKSRISYYNNCSATFNYQHLRLSGDMSPTLDLNQQEFVQIVAGLLLRTIERLGAMAAPRGLI